MIAALSDQDAKVRRAAAATLALRARCGRRPRRLWRRGRQGEDNQILLLAVLADRGDAAALPAVVKAADAGQPGVRLAAVAPGRVGDASVVPLLVAAGGDAAEDAAEQQAAAPA